MPPLSLPARLFSAPLVFPDSWLNSYISFRSLSNAANPQRTVIAADNLLVWKTVVEAPVLGISREFLSSCDMQLVQCNAQWGTGDTEWQRLALLKIQEYSWKPMYVMMLLRAKNIWSQFWQWSQNRRVDHHHGLVVSIESLLGSRHHFGPLPPPTTRHGESHGYIWIF